MARAKETAAIIQPYLEAALARPAPAPASAAADKDQNGPLAAPLARRPALEVEAPNFLLNEGRPCHVVPEGSRKGPSMSQKSVHRDGEIYSSISLSSRNEVTS